MASLLRFLSLTAATVSALTISEINGPKYLSPYSGQTVSNVSGIITAIGPSGLWIRSPTPDRNARNSQSIYVFGSKFKTNLTVGDSIILGGKVQEFRSNSDYVYLTEISSPVLTQKVSSGNKVTPLVIGKDTSDPPTEQYSSLDGGDVFAIRSNVSQISAANPTLDPKKYGMDFWESLCGELVTVRKPTAIAKPNSFGDTWVVGDWKVTGRNQRGGLTMTDKDANPETIVIADPLDGTKNPKNTKLGDELEDITGVITYVFGFYTILPTTAVKVIQSQKPELPSPTKLQSNGKCDGLTFGFYNVENLAPNSTHLPNVASHIVHYLGSPDLVFLQEIQDNDGPTDDAVVSANLTLNTLTAAIASAGGPTYAWADIDPVNDQDGGQPGGNIRVAYLYKPTLLRLYKPNPGGSLDANAVLPGPSLKFNPGRIDPSNAAWTSSRKPLVAQWEVISLGYGRSSKFFTVNVHFSSKDGSGSIQSDSRPPINGAVTARLAQAQLTASFVKSILDQDRDARIITAGDMNEFVFVEPLEQFAKISGLKDLDAVAGNKEVERYTYLFDMNTQQLDHTFVSKSLTDKAKYEHVHINTWVDFDDQVSDHDPSVARLDVCS